MVRLLKNVALSALLTLSSLAAADCPMPELPQKLTLTEALFSWSTTLNARAHRMEPGIRMKRIHPFASNGAT